MNITKTIFGRLADGRDVCLFKLCNDNFVQVAITNYGGIVTSVLTPAKNGESTNIVCGFDRLDAYLDKAYLSNYPYFGAICGRICNRIGKGSFTLDGKPYQLAINNGPNHLHGGLSGFDQKLWTADLIENSEEVGIKLTYTSPHLEEGYPGNLMVTCNYTLNNKNEFGIEFLAHTDQTTLVNLTNHTYFNLTGGKSTIHGHQLMLASEQITENIDLIPTGRILPVAGTPFDFTTFKTLGEGIALIDKGYDQNFVLDNKGGQLVFAGCLKEETSGRTMEIWTTQPGIQLYTGYWIPEFEVDGKKKFGSYSGVALETQHFPDSINQPSFPTVVLEPGDEYVEKTIYRFGIED